MSLHVGLHIAEQINENKRDSASPCDLRMLSQKLDNPIVFGRGLDIGVCHNNKQVLLALGKILEDAVAVGVHYLYLFAVLWGVDGGIGGGCKEVAFVVEAGSSGAVHGLEFLRNCELSAVGVTVENQYAGRNVRLCRHIWRNTHEGVKKMTEEEVMRAEVGIWLAMVGMRIV